MSTKEQEFQGLLPYQFQDISLLKQALTHSSFANECKNSRIKDNERLEFLGDAVLEIVTSDFLYRKYPQESEGALSKKRVSMVCEQSLDYCARQLGVPTYLYLGRGEENTGGRKRPSIVSDAMEAIIGAVYLDGGMESAFPFVEELVLKKLDGKLLYKDSKTALQELVQAKSKETITYKDAGSTGPDHNKTFYVELYIGDQLVAKAQGHTKKAAEQAAAMEAIQEMTCI